MAQTDAQIIASTFEAVGEQLTMSIMDNHALFIVFKEKKRITKKGGGRELEEPVALVENESYTEHSPYGVLNVRHNNKMTKATYHWRLGTVTAQIAGAEFLMNMGKYQKFELWGAEAEIAGETLKNGFVASAYSDGTGPNGTGLQIDGIQSKLTTTPATGTVGGISRATYPNWRNQARTGVNSSDLLIDAMHDMHLATYQPGSSIDCILMGDTQFRFYEDHIGPERRYTSARKADAGITSYDFKGATIMQGGGLGGEMPTNHVYMLNSKYLRFAFHKDRFFGPLDDQPASPIDQDVRVMRIGFMANLTASALRNHAIITN